MSDLPKLTVSREEAQEKLEQQISDGDELIGAVICDREELKKVRERRKSWEFRTSLVLRSIISGHEILEKFDKAGRTLVHIIGPPDLRKDINEEISEIRDKNCVIKMVCENLDRYEIECVDRLNGQEYGETEGSKSLAPKKIFIVHGHKEAYRDRVARFLSKLGLEGIVLFEMPSHGKTVVEKFETYIQDVGFAIVILSGDDEGKAKNESAYRLRARQNVILEMGYFWGRLGRQHVLFLKEDDIELPSDYHGIVYTPIDRGGAWIYEMAKALKAAGYDVDLNLL